MYLAQKYKAIPAKNVAKAMIEASILISEGKSLFTYKQIQDLNPKN